MKEAIAQMADAHSHAAVAAKTTQVVGATVTLFGFSVNEWGVIVGIVLGILSYATQLYYKRKELRMKEKFYASKIPDDGSDDS